MGKNNTTKPELLAPAGDRECAYAAFDAGADAVYTGLKRFSARAEAVNCTFDELDEIVSFAHSGKKRVFVTLNTLVTEDETPEMIETLAAVSDIGPDAVIVQDLGVVRMIREYFPSLRMHASTQMAVHNAAGALELEILGFKRVTLARELSLAEIGEIARRASIEVEVFAHGALCYSYSGLCLYSAMLRNRSGNRGKCAYPCRDAFKTGDRNAGRGDFMFSMKDLALADRIPELAGAGIAALKIEGRKKSSAYVAATTALYRGLLDGRLSAKEVESAKWDIRSIFSRPWTSLYLDGNRKPGVTDMQTVGHRGAPVGKVAALLGAGSPAARIRFAPERRIERHDGIQVDVPGGKPFGFAITDMRIVIKGGKPKSVFEARAGETVEIAVPRDHPPMGPGTELFIASSQAVKRRYALRPPKRGLFRTRLPIDVSVTVRPDSLTAAASAVPWPGASRDVSVTASRPGRFEAARSETNAGESVVRAFSRIGDTSYTLRNHKVQNPDKLFVPASDLNEIRRMVVKELDNRVAAAKRERMGRIMDCFRERAAHKPLPSRSEWSLKVDRIDVLDAIDAGLCRDGGDVVIGISGGMPESLRDGLAGLSGKIGRERIRLALPVITRSWETAELRRKIAMLLRDGWRRWEAGNLSAWNFLGGPAGIADLDITCDWPLYSMNTAAIRQLASMGATGVVAPPESTVENTTRLADFADLLIVPVYQSAPLFISETCPRASGRCEPKRECGEWSEEITSGNGECLIVRSDGCRTVVLPSQPVSLMSRIGQLRKAGISRFRADFSNCRPAASEITRIVKECR